MGDELTEEDQRDMEGLRADDPARDPALLQFQLRVARAPDQVRSAAMNPRFAGTFPQYRCCFRLICAACYQVVRYRLGGPPMWAGRQHRQHRPIQEDKAATAAGGDTGAGGPTLQPYDSTAHLAPT